MNKRVLLILLLFYSCNKTNQTKFIDTSVAIKTIPDTILPILSKEQEDSSLFDFISKQKSVLGYRFIIKGDFDGDEKKEYLTEHYYYSKKNKQEKPKYYDSLTYDQLAAIAIKTHATSFISCSNNYIDTIFQSTIASFGLSYLKNEGDLNGDGNDEISYVVNKADWSNLNTSYLLTYKNNNWETLYTFPIWDWQIPNLPEINYQRGLWGTEDIKILDPKDSIIPYYALGK